MKLPNHLKIARLTFVTILLIALSSGCFFAGKNWDSWFTAVAENSLPPSIPAPQPRPEGGDVVYNSDNNDLYTDFKYKDKTYRVEKSLLTEEGSKYNANKRFYRFLNGKWEMKEGTADAKWKTATLSDISLVLTKWDEKFRTTPPVTPPTTPPVTTPPVTSPPKDPKPPKTPPTEIPKETTSPNKTLSAEEKAQKFEEIRALVRAGKCNADCIIKKVKEFQLSPSQHQKLYSHLP